MSRMAESKHLARAIREHTRNGVSKLGHKLVKATVTRINPLGVELMRSDIVIDEEHLLLSGWLRHFDSRWGIEVGDTLLMSQLDDGDWYVLDVVSQEEFDLGDRPDLMTVLPYNTGSGHVVAEIPYYDQGGILLGQLLIYDKATLRDFAGHTTAAGSGAPVVPN